MPRSAKKPLAANRLSRPPLERMQRIHHALAEGTLPNCTTLAKKMEVSAKTIQRDIDFMRDRQGLPIEFDTRRNGFYYTQPVESLPTVQVTEGEVVALYVAQKVLAQYKGTQFEKPLAVAFEKLTAGLQDVISFPLAAMDDAISFRATGVAEAELGIFETLHQAITACDEVVIRYKSLSDRAARSRWVQPYHLLGVANAWYLIGFDKERDAFRVFALPRIRKVDRVGKTFTRLTDFNPKHLLKGSLGIFIGRESFRIRVRFDAFAAQLVRERQWHESQVITELPGEELELTLSLNSLFEVERWILSWGPHAEVLEPPQLRAQIRAKAEAMAASYSSEDPGMEWTSPTLWEYAGVPEEMVFATPGARVGRRAKRPGRNG
jgi:predicted DNA-binding transcriptional regulator YafY